MKKALVAFCGLMMAFCANAQSKVFKEVSEDISSKMRVITQDGALVGYLVFTQLEKANADSFNYKISIMDENLNDIGAVNFREENMDLQAVSFEEDVLCLAYLKSNIIGTEFKNKKSYKKEKENAKHALVFQFLGLDGKIIKVTSSKLDIDVSAGVASTWRGVGGYGSLKQNVQLRNIPQKGFACFYGDETGNTLATYSLAGNQMWKKKITDAQGFYLLTSGSDVYLLSKQKNSMYEGGYQVNGYSAADTTAFDKYVLQDKQGNQMRVLSFENDPATGKPVITGNIINERKGNDVAFVKGITKGAYTGVFTVALNGPKKADRKETFSYWNDASLAPAISENGRYEDNGSYSRFTTAFRDFEGNTYFVGSSLVKKTRWGCIASSVIFAPTLIVPAFIGANGYTKFKIQDAMLLKQNAKGALAFENTIPCNSTSYTSGKYQLSLLDKKSFYNVSNTTTKSNYLIVDDEDDIVIYNVKQRKVVRTVPHKDGRVRTNIFPAKEGSILVQEYNKKEKYTKFSIEAL